MKYEMRTLVLRFYRNVYQKIVSVCEKTGFSRHNPLARVLDIDNAVQVGLAEFKVLGSTGPQDNALPDYYLNDEYQISHLQNYSREGRVWQYRYGIIKINRAFFSFPYPIHRAGRYLIDRGLGDSLKYLCEPRFVVGYLKTFLPPRRRLDKVIFIPLPSYENFYHWMIETLPRLQMLLGQAEYDDFSIVLPRGRTPRFVYDSLALSGWDKRIKFLENGQYSVGELYIPTLFSPRNEPCAFSVRWLNENVLGDECQVRSFLTSDEYKRIFISRDDADSRGVVNATELDDLIREVGLKKVRMTDFSVREQAYMFSRAELIVGLHGAALTNVAYSKPECTLIEIFMEGWFTRAFFNLSRLRGLKYGYFLCQKQGNGVFIDTIKLKRLIDSVKVFILVISLTGFTEAGPLHSNGIAV